MLGAISSVTGILNFAAVGLNCFQIHHMSKKLGKMDGKLTEILVSLWCAFVTFLFTQSVEGQSRVPERN